MNRSATSTADGLGLDPRIGGHDRLVVLCLLAHHHDETGKVATAGELAELSGIGPEELAAGPLAGLVGAGCAELGVVQTSTDAPAYAGKATFAGRRPSVGLIQRTGYRITKEGLNALDGHLSALGALPGSPKSHLLVKSSGKAAPAEGAGAREQKR